MQYVVILPDPLQELAVAKYLKATAAKTLFSSVYVFGEACFDECFLFHVIT